MKRYVLRPRYEVSPWHPILYCRAPSGFENVNLRSGLQRAVQAQAAEGLRRVSQQRLVRHVGCQLTP